MNATLINIVRELKYLGTHMDAYIDTIPRDISEAFFDNEYTNLQAKQRDILLEALFGDMSSDIEWFLYEFQAGETEGPHCILQDGKEFTFNTNEDYYEYLKDNG